MRHSFIVFSFFCLLIPCLLEAAHPANGRIAPPYPGVIDTVPARLYSLTADSFMIGRGIFMQRYGQDDSSRALIGFYFQHRGDFSSFQDPADPAGSLLALLFFGTLLLPLLIYYRLRFPRRKLWLALYAYENGYPIPRRIARKMSYQRILREMKSSR
ncbi:MAG TPA: hypothetical protein VNS58_31550 [Puia sp.]|nr:hypothetical protein [Puia sp.]